MGAAAAGVGALLGGSALFGQLGASQAAGARGETLDEYFHRLKKLMREAVGVNTRELGIAGYEPTMTALPRAIYQRTSTQAPLLDEHIEALPTSSSAPSAVANAYGSASHTQKHKLAGDITRGARLNALGDVFQDQAIGLGRAQQDLSRIANFEQGNAQILPLQLQQASHAGDFYSLLGSLLGQGATLAGLGGFSGNAVPPAAAVNPGSWSSPFGFIPVAR